MAAKTPRKNYTVTIDGTVIAAFLMSDDAVFFARTARDAGMFELTNPGAEPIVYDGRGSQIPLSPTYTTH